MRQHNRNPRSYIAKTTDGQSYRRNRQHLLKTKESWTSLNSNKDHLDDDTYSNTDNDNRNYGKRDNYIQSERQQFKYSRNK